MTFALSVLGFTMTPIAKAAGAGDRRLAARLAVQSLWLAALFGVVFLGLAACAGLVVGRPEEALYLRYLLGAGPLVLMVGAVSTCLTAQRAGGRVLVLHALLCALQVAWYVTLIPTGG